MGPLIYRSYGILNQSLFTTTSCETRFNTNKNVKKRARLGRKYPCKLSNINYVPRINLTLILQANRALQPTKRNQRSGRV